MTPLERFFSRDRLALLLGIKTVSCLGGRAEAEMTLSDQHLNGLNTAHGGALFSLADFAFALACNSGNVVSVALSATISFSKAVGLGTRLRAVAEEISSTKKTGVYSVTITDDAGDVVALFQGTAYRKKETVEEAVRKADDQP
jgi:acyl-CoA thioesterase